jgi:hypothetical protein
MPLQPKTPRWLVCTFVALCTFAVTSRAQPASAEVAYAVTETNKLVRFETGQALLNVVGTISGTAGGEQILSIDFRPLTGRLYGISASRLYTIDPFTAQAQLASVAAFPAPLVGNADMDFDPVSGLIRVITDTNQNLRIDPATGAVTTDTPISGVPGSSGWRSRTTSRPPIARRCSPSATTPMCSPASAVGTSSMAERRRRRAWPGSWAG